MSKEAMKLALDALEKLVRFESDSWEIGSCRIAGQATKALREALAEQPAQPQQASDPDNCASDVFEHGTSLGLFDMPKEDAEKYCKAETERTGYKHDWHYIGGRVHVKALITPPPAQRKPLTKDQIAKFYGGDSPIVFQIIRDTEAAHGIKENT